MISIIWRDGLIYRCASCGSEEVGGYELVIDGGNILCLECVDLLRQECEDALE